MPRRPRPPSTKVVGAAAGAAAMKAVARRRNSCCIIFGRAARARTRPIFKKARHARRALSLHYAGLALLLDRAGVRPYIGPLRVLPMGNRRGGVAQLVRVSACHAEGRGFEPRRSRHFLLENGSF